jgi:hypothetical protein
MIMKTLLFSLILVACSLQTSAQRHTSFEISPFKSIDIFGAFDVELIKADKEDIQIDYNGVHRDNIVLDVYRDKLKLKLKNRHYIDEWTSSSQEYRPSRNVKVKLYYKEIESITANAGANIQSDDVFKLKEFDINAGMGGIVNLKVNCRNIAVKTSMGAEVFMKGKAEELEVNANMGGVLNASALESKFVQVRASMGADVHVQVLEELDASSGFGAVVRYVGGPSVKHTTTNFGGEIRQKR